MKNGWQYVQTNGTSEKMAPWTLIDYVKMNEDEDAVSLKDAMPSNPNLLINGDFQVWQRGISFTGPGYTADRWRVQWAVPSVSKINGGMRIQFADEWRLLSQEIEVFLPAGMKITLSTELKSSVPRPFVMYISVNGTVVADYLNINATTAYVRYSKTITVPTDATSVKVRLENPTTMTSDLDIRYIKAELGSVATPLVPRPYAEELAMCQRYYETNLGNAYPQHLGSAIGTPTTGILAGGLMWKVKKRAVPTVKIFDTLASTPNTCTRDNTGTMDYTGQSSLTYGITPDGCLVLSMSGANATSIKCYYAADAEIY